MAKQTINIGEVANDGTGDPLRSAFDKINDNFDELYNNGGLVTVPDITYTGTLNYTITLNPIIPTGAYILNTDEYIIGSNNGCWLEEVYFDELNIETVSFNNLVGVKDDFYVSYTDYISNISAPLLEYVGGDFNLNDLDYTDAPVQLYFPKLKYVVDEFSISSGEGIYGFEFPELVSTDYFYVSYLENLTTIGANTFPKLENVTDYMGIYDNNQLISVEFPVLNTVDGTFSISDNNNLETINLPMLENIYGSIEFYNNDSLVNVSIPSLKEVRSNFYIEGNLPTDRVDYILELLHSLDGTNGTTLYENQTIGIDQNDPPSLNTWSIFNDLVSRNHNVYIKDPELNPPELSVSSVTNSEIILDLEVTPYAYLIEFYIDDNMVSSVFISDGEDLGEGRRRFTLNGLNPNTEYSVYGIVRNETYPSLGSEPLMVTTSE